MISVTMMYTIHSAVLSLHFLNNSRHINLHILMTIILSIRYIMHGDIILYLTIVLILLLLFFKYTYNNCTNLHLFTGNSRYYILLTHIHNLCLCMNCLHFLITNGFVSISIESNDGFVIQGLLTSHRV